ncbi:MAG: M14 family metallopeptidase [Acidobacteriota bacterium]
MQRLNARPGILFLLTFLASSAIAQTESFAVGSAVAAPGTVASGRIDIAPRGDDEGTFIPITVAHGAQPGPTMGLIAGIHGSEYAPILALQKLRPLLDAAELRGTVILVHAANIPAFEGRTIYFGPVDRKNLNRSFPGRPDGTITDRIAHALVQQVISRSDYVMDMHAGDGNEGLRPSYSAYYAEAGSSEVIEKSKRMAIAFGLDTIVAFRGDLTVESAIWCGASAVALDIPAIDIESGQRGLTDDEYVDPIVDGILSVLRDLDMMPGDPTPAADPFIVKDRARVYAKSSGLWTPDPRIKAGDYVTEGARLGVIKDWYGNVVQEAFAPKSGALLILFQSPPVNEGDNLAVIARVE